MDNHQIELLRKFLDNRCSPGELEQVKQLLQLPQNRELLDKLIADQAATDWHETGYADEALKPTVDRWKNKLNKRIHQQSAGRMATLWPRRLRHIAAVTAGILLLGGITFWSIKNSTPELIYVEKQNQGGAPVKYLLPDSSEVHLAAGSHIRYPERFVGKTREVLLEGEAFFDVRPDQKKPFIIHTGKVHTQVLGTSFRVTAYKGSPLEVAVASGKVQVTDHQKGQPKQLALLTKGRKVSYHPDNGTVELGTTDPASLQQWAAGEVFFEGQRLDRIAEALHRIYGASFHIEQAELEALRVSAAFSATEPIDSVMEMLAFVGKFQYRYDTQKKLYTLYTKK